MSTYQHEDTRRPQTALPPPPPFPPPAPDLRIIQDDHDDHDDQSVDVPGGDSAADDLPSREVSPVRRPSSPSRQDQRSRRSRLRLGDRRGLTGLGAVSLVVFFAALTGAVDGSRTADGLGIVFGLTFVVCCVLAALGAHTEDLGAIAILPPLAYFVAAVVCALVRPTSSLKQVADELLIAMLIGAPWLFLAQALTLVTTGLRGARHRVAVQQRLRQTPTRSR